VFGTDLSDGLDGAQTLLAFDRLGKHDLELNFGQLLLDWLSNRLGRGFDHTLNRLVCLLSTLSRYRNIHMLLHSVRALLGLGRFRGSRSYLFYVSLAAGRSEINRGSSRSLGGLSLRLLFNLSRLFDDNGRLRNLQLLFLNYFSILDLPF